MKLICLQCGKSITKSDKNLFCSKDCFRRFKLRHPPLKLNKDYDALQHLTQRAETFAEFEPLYRKYFMTKRKEELNS